MSSKPLTIDLKRLRLPAWLMRGAPAESSAGGLRVKYPPVAVGMGASRMPLVRLTRTALMKWTIGSFEQVEVPPDLVEAELFRVRIKSPERFGALVAEALKREAVKTPSISLVLPDHFARVALLPFEELPRARQELVDMIRWKMKKAVPFKVEEAAVDYQITPGVEGKGHMVLAVLIPGAIIEEHEAIFRMQGIHPGLIDLSSFSVAHLYRSVIDQEVPASEDFMLLNVGEAFFTVMIFRLGRLLFYRCKNFAFVGEEDERHSDDRLMRREIQTSLMYYQERLGGKRLARVYMRLVDMKPERAAAMFEGAPLASPPAMIDVGRVVSLPGRITALGPDRATDTLQRIAPVVGAALGRNP